MAEGFRPVSNTPPVGFMGKLKFYGRMLLDLQINTIYKDIKNTIPAYKGNVLDVGCGQSPYKYLLDANATKYFGIDIVDADKFDYNNKDITPFNGEDIPFEDNKFDAVICTEVLEHVYNYPKLISEMHRVMKPGATGIVTIPWSARYHYMPWDFFRYTPSTQKNMFAAFSSVESKPRGTDVSTIIAKLIVLYVRSLMPKHAWKYIFIPFWLLMMPVMGILVAIAHISLWFNIGTDDDPLGYTIIIKK